MTTTVPASPSRSSASASAAPRTPPAIGPCPQEWTGPTPPVRPHGGDGVVEADEADRRPGALPAQVGAEGSLHSCQPRSTSRPAAASVSQR